jgi:hypothetical protein
MLDLIEALVKIFQFIAHSPWALIAGLAAPVIGYAWTTKVANVTSVAAAHINLLQTEKVDRDGSIPMTGPLLVGVAAQLADEIDGLYVVTPNPITVRVGRGGNFVSYYGGTYASTGLNAFAHVVGANNQNHCYGTQSWVFGDGSGTVTRAAGYMAAATIDGNTITTWYGYLYSGVNITSGACSTRWAFYTDSPDYSKFYKTAFTSEVLTPFDIPYTVYAYDAFTSDANGLTTGHLAAFSNTTAAVGVGGIVVLGGKSGAATSPYPFAFILGAKELSGATYNGYLAFYTGDGDSHNSEKARISSAGKMTIARPAASESFLDSAVYVTWSFANGATAVNEGIYSAVTNTGNAASSGGHVISILGRTYDTIANLQPMYGVEGRVDGASPSANYGGVFGIVNWVDSAAGNTTVRTGTLCGFTTQVGMFDYDGTTPRTTGTAIVCGIKVGQNYGGLYNYGIYIDSQTTGVANIGLMVYGASTFAVWLNAGADIATPAGGIAFGASADTNLYRSGANILATDDAFKAGAGFGCNGAAPQATVVVNAASSNEGTVVALCNQIRTALIANGICAAA